MDLELQGKVVVVTGGSRGIGLAVVRAMAAEGAHVVVGARRSSPALDELAATGDIDVVLGDLTDPGGPTALVERAGERVDVLVNNVGAVTPRPAGFSQIEDQDWKDTLELGLLTPLRAIRAVLPRMVAAGSGTVVTIGSVNAFLPDPVVIDYGATKAALVNACKALSKEVGPHGIRVNTVDPGPVATDFWLGEDGVAQALANGSGHGPDDVARTAVADTATGRFTEPEEVAALVLLLASGRTANVTGTGFTIDGGLDPSL